MPKENKTNAAIARAVSYVEKKDNKQRFEKVEGSKEWFVLQVGLVAGQLLEGFPRLNRAYDLKRFEEVFNFALSSVNDIGPTVVLDEMVRTTELTMALIEEARPEKFEIYSKGFLRDIFKVVYNLTE